MELLGRTAVLILLVSACQAATIFVSDQNTRTVWTADPFEENDLFVGAAFSGLPLQGIVTVWALDYDEVDEMIYWTDQGSAQISRSKLDGSEKMTIVSQPNAVFPRGIALDHDNNRIYWADAGTRKVESATLTGSDRQTLATGLVEARDVELSVKHGIVFWCQDGSSGRLIERSDLDGANRTVIVQSGLTKPTGLAVNYDETRLYWCDYEKQTIESVEFDGSNRIVHVDSNTIAGYAIRPWRMALYGQDDEIYFTDNVNRILFGTNANGGFSAVPRTNFFAYPYDIAFVSDKSSAVTVQPPTEPPTTQAATTVQSTQSTPNATQTPIPDAAVALDICGTGTPATDVPGNVTSPGFPSPYPANLTCAISLQAPDGSRLRLRFETVNLDNDADFVLVVDQDGIQTWITGTSSPKDFVGESFQISFESDAMESGGSGFVLMHEVYTRVAVRVTEYMQDFDLQPGKALHLYTNDYPMLYDDNTHYLWNITSSETNAMTITVVDMDTEEQRDWLKVTGYLAASASQGEGVELLYASGTPTEDPGQMIVENVNYVLIDFRTDYSRNGRGFHIVLETTAVAARAHSPSNTCDGTYTVTSEAIVLDRSSAVPNEYCVWVVQNEVTGSRLHVLVQDSSIEDGDDYLQVSSGVDPTDWKSYRRRLTGVVDLEEFYIEEGSGVSFVYASGENSVNRTVKISIQQAQDNGCNGVLDLTTDASREIDLGSFSSNATSAYCQWFVQTSPLSNINVQVLSTTGTHYSMLEIGQGSDPTAVDTRQKLLASGVENMTFSTFGGDLWIAFTATDLTDAGDISVYLTFNDDACKVESLLDLSGTIQSPVLAGGLYPHDADCQWIVQVRGGYQVRLIFTEFDLEYGHDQLIIGGTVPSMDDVDSEYLVLTGSSIPSDVVSRFNGLNIRFKTDSSIASSGFKLTYQEFVNCPDGYERESANDTCYKFVSTPTGWFDARYDCTDVADGDLVVINDQAENDFVLDKILAMGDNSTDWWIGYYDAAINGEWVWVDCAEPNTFAETKWQVGAPNNMDDDHCAYVSLSDGMYNDDACANMRGYVCEITRKSYVDSDCYPSNFRVMSLGANDISVAFNFSEYICDVSGYKIRYNTSVPGVYEEVELVGARNTAVTITGLNPLTTYHFELTTCTVSYGCYGYSTALSVLGKTVCPNNYEEGPTGHCYRFRILDLGSWWSTGRRTCDNEPDSDLVIIDSQVELDFLMSRTAAINSNMTWWIGYSDQSVEGDWRWVDCETSTSYQEGLWMAGSPSTVDSGRLDCAALQSTGDIVDLGCDTALSYICEISPKGFDLLDANPSDLSAEGRASSIDVTWSQSLTSCDVIGYRVNYWKPEDDISTKMSVLVYGGDVESATIAGLPAGTAYYVTVNAILSQDYELPPVGPITVNTLDGIVLVCAATTMSVTVPLARLSGATQGADLYLQNDATCEGVISQDGTSIVITTDLTGCNNNKMEDAQQESYSNIIVDREDSVVSRVSDVYIPFTCAYNRTGRVGLRSYELQNYRVNSTETSDGQYAFSLDIYRDETFSEKYDEVDYPVDVDLNDDLYFGASVPSQDMTLDLSITRCVATPSSSYNDDQYAIIEEGCAVDESTSIQSDGLDFVGVTMKTFRFVDLGNRVYIHCDLLVCDATSEGPTECDVTCPGSTNARQRREAGNDVSNGNSLARKRITRGPLRLRRSVEDNFSQNDEAASPHINLWMLTVIAMATILIVLAAGIIVTIRKLRSSTADQKKMTTDNEACTPLLDEQ